MEKFKNFLDSFENAWFGISSCIEERNFRFHLVMTAYVLLFSYLGRVSRTQFTILLICIGAVLTAEVFNTAIENLCDYIKRDFDLRIGTIKDISAGAVLIIAIAAAIVGLVIFLSRDVFSIAMQALSSPWILIPFLVSIPLALVFIFHGQEKDSGF